MDALKKAEAAKRQAEAAGMPAGSHVALPAVTSTAPNESSVPVNTGDQRGLPELPTRLELLDDEFDNDIPRVTSDFHTVFDQGANPTSASTSTPSIKWVEPLVASSATTPPLPNPPSRPFVSTAASAKTKHDNNVAQEQERAAAQNLFTAKQPPAKTRNMFPFVVGGGALIAVICIGIYFWWQLQPKGGLAARPGVLNPAVTPAVPPLPTTAFPNDITPAPSSSVQPYVTPSAPPLVPPLASPSAAQKTHNDATLGMEMDQSANVNGGNGQNSGQNSEQPPVRITRGQLQLNPAIARAYQAFEMGDLVAAQRNYEQVLSSEPKNIAALHGLAAISLRQGKADLAEDYYLRVLEADPKDAAALASMISLRGQVDSTQSESRLKSLLNGQPDSPFLNFALGNLYAKQNRWSEAQQAYFRAYSVDGDNPDYLFNLAISLEQLRQPKLALQYYQQALLSAEQRPAAFDKTVAANRVRALMQNASKASPSLGSLPSSTSSSTSSSSSSSSLNAATTQP